MNMGKGNVTLIPKTISSDSNVILNLQNVELKERKIILSPDTPIIGSSNNYIDTEEASNLTGYSKDTICNWCRKGKLQAKKRRGRWLVNKSSLQNFLLSISKIHVIAQLEIRPKMEIEEKVEKDLVFISYSHKDAVYLREFRIHISKRLEKRINIWSDHCILPGTKWKEEIEKVIRATKIAILFVSANFFKSDFINEEELPPILESAETNGTNILSVYLRYCDYEEYPEIVQYQAINSPDIPISIMDQNERDKIWINLIKEIKRQLGLKAPNKS